MPIGRWLAITAKHIGVTATAIGASVALIGSTAYAAERGNSYTQTIAGNVTATVAAADQWLNAGDSWFFGHSRLLMRSNGELVILKGKGTVAWRSKYKNGKSTAGSGAVKMTFDCGYRVPRINCSMFA